jgi:hypothetical protein
MLDTDGFNARRDLALAHGPRVTEGIPDVGLARRRDALVMTR